MEKINNEIRQCSKCKQNRTIDNFKPECKQCNVCLDAKKRYRQKHKDTINKYAKEYYIEHRETMLEQIKTWNNTYTDCFYCKCPVRNNNASQHVKTNKHIRNMYRYHEMEQPPKPKREGKEE